MKNIIHQTIRPLLLATALACVPLSADAASASELLEKAIYTEETKGDIDSAIAIYQQIVTDTKAAQALGAQAQYRLGLCLAKKNRSAEATAAFEKLVRDFPGEKDLVAKAREHLPADLALLPVPWRDGERLQLTITLGSGHDIGTTEYRAVQAEMQGRKIWRVGARTYASGNAVSSVDVDAATFLPISSTWKHVLLGEATVTYRPGEAEVTRVGKEPLKVASDKPLYDNEQAMHLMRRLPLAVGYKTVLPVLPSLGSAAVLPVGLEVTGIETVEVPAGKFECFKVALSIGQTMYFSTDAPRSIVKFEAGGVTAALTSITHRAAGAPVPFASEEFGVALTAPADWVLHLRREDKPGRAMIHMLEPGAEAEAVALRLRPTESLSATARTGVRTWAEEDAASHGAKELQNFKIRPASWKSETVNGRLGMSFVADYTNKGQPMTGYSLYVLGVKTSEQFMLVCAAEKLAALQPEFAKIIASYCAK